MSTLSDQVRTSYYDYAKAGQLFVAYATVTSPVIWSTAAGTGGPLLWNGSVSTNNKLVNAVLLGLGVGITTASGAASALGITGGTSVVPTSTTAIDGKANLLMGGLASICTAYRVGTVATAGAWFMPTHSIGTGAVSVGTVGPTWVDLGGSIVVPPGGGWASVAASATATSAVLDVALVWAEIPVE